MGLGLWALLGLSFAMVSAHPTTVWAQSEAGIGMPPSTAVPSGRVVLEQEWARRLAEALGVTGIFAEAPGTDELFGLLCADRGHGVPQGSLGKAQDTAPGAGARVRFRIDVPQTALYQLAVSGRGRQRWTIDGRAIEHIEPGGLGVAIPSELIPLRAGPHELEVFTGIRGVVDRIDLSVFRPLCIAPVDGWREDRPLTHAAAARTLVRAMGLVPLLPVTAAPITLDGSGHALRGEDRRDPLADRVTGARGEPRLLEYPVTISEPGMHSIVARVRGLGEQIWSFDDRYRSRVRIGGDAIRAVHVMSIPLATGEHRIRVSVPAGGTVDDITLRRHGSRGSDQLALLDRLGLRPRAPGALVTLAEARGYLESGVFRERAERFLRREGLRGPAAPVVLAEQELPAYGNRPLSPLLPAEL